MRRIGCILAAIWIVTSLTGCVGSRAWMGAANVESDEIDVAIITVLPEEYHSVLRKLENVRPVIEKDGRPNVYAWAVGELRSSNRATPRRLVVAMAGESGEVSGALATQATIARWRPRTVLLVGIAGGVERFVALGDVVIASQIWGYEHGHLGKRYDAGGLQYFQPDSMLVKAAIELGSEWTQHIEATAPTPDVNPKVVVGKNASGNKVVENASSVYFAESLLQISSVVSVEMEGAGAAAAVGRDHDLGGTTGFLMIRGISDLIDVQIAIDAPHVERGKNPQRGRWKDYAADVAASFAVGLIKSNLLD
jgi:adenosylhomocysteine nucleosidase